MNPKAKDPRVALFDEIVLSKRNRGRTSLFTGRHTADFISDTSNHLWRTASATFAPSSKSLQNLSGDHSRIVTRGKSLGGVLLSDLANNVHRIAPAKLDTSLMREPRMIHGTPRVSKAANTARRKPLPKLMTGLSVSPT